MKRAKNKLSPTLKQLISSTRRAERSMVKAIAFVGASNYRLDRKKPKLNRKPSAHQPSRAEALMRMPNVGQDSDFERV